ncbi:hypothetical protein SBY92_005353 [Candida maltosa Xu316]
MASRSSPSSNSPSIKRKRVVSMASTSTIPLSGHYSPSIDLTQLYRYLLKIILLEYSNEARFRTPILESIKSTSRPSSFINTTNTNRLSGLQFDQKLPNYVIKNMKTQLQLIMTNQKQVDDKFRRSLLRMYGELLDPNQENEVKKIDFLIFKFAAFSNQELKKITQLSDEELNQNNVTNNKKDYDSALVNQLKQRKQDVLQKNKSKNNDTKSTNVKYPTKSYRITDMNTNYIDLVKKIFNVDDTQLQSDVFKYKDIALAKPVHNDTKQFEKLNTNASNFPSESALSQWKSRQATMRSQILNRYKIPADLTLLPLPNLPEGEEYYIIPKTDDSRNFFIAFVSEIMKSKSGQNFSDPNTFFLEKSEMDFINIVARVWHIDYPTRAVAIYSAAQEANALVDIPIDKKNSPVDIPASEKIFHLCKQMVEDGGLDWDEKQLWLLEDQDDLAHNLSESYNQTFIGLKENLQLIFHPTIKPKFGPYLQFLDEYIESDSLFPQMVEATGLPKKWEKRLTKTLMKVAGTRYGEYLSTIPRNGTVNVLHLVNVCDTLIQDIKKLQKKYKNPLLGFLNVARTVASITTGMFASDAEATVTYIQTIVQNNGERIPYSDALEVYQLLSEIRDIHNQVTPSGSKFNFHLEKFFFPYLESWVDESEEKIQVIVNEAIKKDTYQPINLDEDEKRSSTAVLDIFTIIKNYLIALKKQNWNNEYQLSSVYTKLLQSISKGAITYSDQVTDKIKKELEQPPPASTQEEPQESTKKNWLNEVKNVVSNIQNFKRPEPVVVYNFQPETCVALNNLSAMMHNITKLEDWLDPESISNSIATYNPNSKNTYLSHVFTIRIIRGENLRASKDSTVGKINPYVTIVDLIAKKPIGTTRVIETNPDPEWDEEFEVSIPPNTSLDTSIVVWDDRFGQHRLCGKAFLELNPRKFKHNGIPEEITLDLDLQGKVILEIAVESETSDPIFVMGRAYRCLKTAQERSIKLIVEKFSGFIQSCFSRTNLKAVCAKGQPSRDEFEASLENLCDYLNMNLSILKEFLMDENFMNVMIITWKTVIKAADELMLPKLSKAKINTATSTTSSSASVSLSLSGTELNTSWQSMTSKFSNVSLSSIGILGMDGPLLSINEIETILGWLGLLCQFFHNDGNGPSMEDLKTDQYQSLLLVPALYDQTDEYLIDEVERLSPAYVQMLNNRNNADLLNFKMSSNGNNDRTRSLLRNKTINANATAKARQQAAQEVKESRGDPIASKTSKEDIILRILIARGRKEFVSQRLNQRAKLAYSMATERMVRVAAERKFT